MKLLNIHFLLLLSSDDTERTVSELPCILMSVITVYTLTEHTQMNTLTLDLFLFIFITVSSFLFFWHIYTVIYEHTVKQRNMPIQVCSKKKNIGHSDGNDFSEYICYILLGELENF